MTTTTQDVEMKDNNQTPPQSIVSATPSTLQRNESRSSSFFTLARVFENSNVFPQTDLKEIAALIDTGSYTKEVRRVARAVRLTVGIRQKLTGSVVSSFLDFALGHGSEAHARLSSFVPKVYLWLIRFFISVEYIIWICVDFFLFFIFRVMNMTWRLILLRPFP